MRPSQIYVEPVMAMKAAGIDLKGLAHITSGGLLKLPRLSADVGYVIDNLPEPHPIFRLIQERAKVRDEEMYEDFNMGIGFCVIVPPHDENRAIEVARQHGSEAMRIGYVNEGADRMVRLEPVGLEGRKGIGFHKI